MCNEKSEPFVDTKISKLWRSSEKSDKVFLNGLAMIFAGQENPLIIFKSKERYILNKANLQKKKKKRTVIAEIMKKGTFGKFHYRRFNKQCLISYNFKLIMCVF